MAPGDRIRVNDAFDGDFDDTFDDAFDNTWWCLMLLDDTCWRLVLDALN